MRRFQAATASTSVVSAVYQLAVLVGELLYHTLHEPQPKGSKDSCFKFLGPKGHIT